MAKVAVLFAPGFEEIEALTPVDVFRRAEIPIDMVGFDEEVTGAHGVTVKMDQTLASVNLKHYELLILPGGLPGATHLRDRAEVITALEALVSRGDKVAAICAGPIALAEAGALEGKAFTCFPGFEDEIKSGDHQADELVVVSDNVITSRGPATALEFSYQLVDIFGGHSKPLRSAMQYDFLRERG